MSQGERLQRASDALAQAKTQLDVMIIKRRIDRRILETVTGQVDHALSELREILKHE